MTRPYEDQLQQAKVVGWNEGWVVWQWRQETMRPFTDRPYNAHPVAGHRLAGSGIYDLTAAEATELTGIPLV